MVYLSEEVCLVQEPFTVSKKTEIFFLNTAKQDGGRLQQKTYVDLGGYRKQFY